MPRTRLATSMRMNFKKTYQVFLSRAQLSIELGAIALLVIVLCLLTFDIVVVLWGFQLLDLAARDAVRAGGSTGNATAGLKAAQQAALSHKADGYFVTQPTV